MDNLNSIPKSGSYGDGVDLHNDNYQKIGVELQTLRELGQNEKGYFEDLSSLQSKYPTPQSGWQAYVKDAGSSTGYYVANVNSSGNWVVSSAEAPAVGVELSGYAKTGGSEKTVKEVEDEIVQLAGITTENPDAISIRQYQTGLGLISGSGIVTGDFSENATYIYVPITGGKTYYLRRFDPSDRFRVSSFPNAEVPVAGTVPSVYIDGGAGDIITITTNTEDNGLFIHLSSMGQKPRINVGEVDYSHYISPVNIGKNVLPYIHDAIVSYAPEVFPEMESGTLAPNTGLPSPRPERCRSDYLYPDSIKSIEVTNSEWEFSYGYWDVDNNWLGYDLPYVESRKNFLGHKIRLLVKRKDDADITSADWEGIVKINVGTPVVDVDVFKDVPKFSSVPFGDKVNIPLLDKIDLFEQTFNNYPATVVKQTIGKSFDNVYDVHAYTLTPESYTVTVAVTGHVHGNEKYNPVGLIALLDACSKEYIHEPFLVWMRDNIRWVIVPIVSPYGYANNVRTLNGIDPNRNMDYRWELNTDSEKGTAPLSQTEAKNISDFFTPLADEIDFHIDAHDIPSSLERSYSPYQNREYVWQREFWDVCYHLANINDVKEPIIPYIGEFGATTNFFTEVLGVPSTTPEHCTAYWRDVIKISPNNQIAKAAEQLAAFIYVFANLHESYKGSAYYKKLICRSFMTEQYGINTWTWQKLHDELSLIPTWTQVQENDDVLSYIKEPISYEKTVMVIAGVTPDDKNSSLVSKWCMELLTKDSDDLAQYVAKLQGRCRIVIVPVLNPDDLVESTLSDSINNLQSVYSPDYTLVIRGLENSNSVSSISGETIDDVNITSYSNKNIDTIAIQPSVGIESNLTSRYFTLHLNNPIPYTHRYAHGVEMWLEAAINDLASYAKEI